MIETRCSDHTLTKDHAVLVSASCNSDSCSSNLKPQPINWCGLQVYVPIEASFIADGNSALITRGHGVVVLSVVPGSLVAGMLFKGFAVNGSVAVDDGVDLTATSALLESIHFDKFELSDDSIPEFDETQVLMCKRAQEKAPLKSGVKTTAQTNTVAAAEKVATVKKEKKRMDIVKASESGLTLASIKTALALIGGSIVKRGIISLMNGVGDDAYATYLACVKGEGDGGAVLMSFEEQDLIPKDRLDVLTATAISDPSGLLTFDQLSGLKILYKFT
jgi:hypothetical protein